MRSDGWWWAHGFANHGELTANLTPAPSAVPFHVPELPEVEHLRRTLEPLVVGARIDRVTVHRRDVISAIRPATVRNGQRTPPGRTMQRDLLRGEKIAAVVRHGKNLAIASDSRRAITVHLGMTGQVMCVPPGSPQCSLPHVHCAWELVRGRRRSVLLFRDPRRFGGIRCGGLIDDVRAHLWSQLGPDGLCITAEQLGDGLARTRRPVKTAILDQTIIAGVGNIYADEALFQARVRPMTPASTLRANRITRLRDAIVDVLTAAVDSGGSTLRDYVDATGSPGRFTHHHLVYGRGNQPCVRCSRTLREMHVSGRTTVFCTRCQRT